MAHRASKVNYGEISIASPAVCDAGFFEQIESRQRSGAVGILSKWPSESEDPPTDFSVERRGPVRGAEESGNRTSSGRRFEGLLACKQGILLHYSRTPGISTWNPHPQSDGGILAPSWSPPTILLDLPYQLHQQHLPFWPARRPGQRLGGSVGDAAASRSLPEREHQTSHKRADRIDHSGVARCN